MKYVHTRAERRNARRVVRVAVAVLAITGTALVAAPVAGAATNAPGTAVRSDGVVVKAENAAASTSVSRSFGGRTGGESATVDGPSVDTAPRFFGSESVIGSDGRVQVNPTTSNLQSKATALITFTQNGSSYICTGWMIGANTLATAGHCVSPAKNQWNSVSSYRIYPAKNGSTNPYGSCTAKWLATDTNWFSNRDANYDYAAIKLNCTVGNSTGWFGFFWQSATLTGLPATIQGYPADKTYGTQWTMSGTIASSNATTVSYSIDTYGGQSGSAIWYNRSGCGVCSMGIHAYGSSGGNSGTRITSRVFNNLVSWKNAS